MIEKSQSIITVELHSTLILLHQIYYTKANIFMQQN